MTRECHNPNYRPTLGNLGKHRTQTSTLQQGHYQVKATSPIQDGKMTTKLMRGFIGGHNPDSVYVVGL